MENELTSNTISEEYKIYNYFEKEPSVVVALFSALIAIVTAVLNFVATSIQNQYLNYWNISTSLIDYNTTNIIQQLSVSTIICLIGAFSLILINTFFAQYYKEQIKNIQEKYALKTCVKSLKRLKIQNKIINIVLFILDKTVKMRKFKGWFYIFQKCRDFVKQKEQLLDTSEKQIKKLKQVYHPKYTGAIIKLFFKVSFVALILWGFLLLFTMRFLNNAYYLEASIILTFFLILLSSLLASRLAKQRIPKKEIKEKVEKYLKDNGDWEYVEYKNNHSQISFKDFLSDAAIKKNIISLLFMISFILVYLCISMSQTAINQKNFNIVEYKGEKYIVLHRFEDSFVLEKATIKGKAIEVDDTKQVIIRADDLTFEYCEFDDIKRKPTDGEK